MRLNEVMVGVVEKRKNADKNPKVSINREILNRYAHTDDMIGGIKNLFVSFTSVEKLGINPGSSYGTPLGVYSYPVKWLMNEVGAEGHFGGIFAGGSKYINLFNVHGNVIVLQDLTEQEYNGYLKKLKELRKDKKKGRGLSENKSWTEAIDWFDKDARKYTRVKSPGAYLWHVTYSIMGDFYDYSSVKWNKLFRSIGIDGCLDLGDGIIHPNEATQCVLFSVKAIKNVTRHLNRYHPVDQKVKRESGEFLKNISRLSIEELVDGMEKYAPDISSKALTKALSRIDSEKKLKLIKFDPSYMQFFNNFTEEEITEIIQKHPRFIFQFDPSPKIAKALNSLSEDDFIELFIDKDFNIGKDKWLKYLTNPNLRKIVLKSRKYDSSVLNNVMDKEKRINS